MRGLLPGGARMPAALRDEARAGIERASALLGPLFIEGVHFIEPGRRPLIHELCTAAAVAWAAPPYASTARFPNDVKTVVRGTTAPEQVNMRRPTPRGSRSLPAGARPDRLRAGPPRRHRDLRRRHRRMGRLCPRVDRRNRPACVLSAWATLSWHDGRAALRGPRGCPASRPEPGPGAASFRSGGRPGNDARRATA